MVKVGPRKEQLFNFSKTHTRRETALAYHSAPLSSLSINPQIKRNYSPQRQKQIRYLFIYYAPERNRESRTGSLNHI